MVAGGARGSSSRLAAVAEAHNLLYVREHYNVVCVRIRTSIIGDPWAERTNDRDGNRVTVCAVVAPAVLEQVAGN